VVNLDVDTFVTRCRTIFWSRVTALWGETSLVLCRCSYCSNEERWWGIAKYLRSIRRVACRIDWNAFKKSIALLILKCEVLKMCTEG